MIEGVYYSPESNEVIVLHKVDIEWMQNTDTGELTHEVITTLEAATIPKMRNVMIPKDNLRKLVYMGSF